MKLQTYRHFIVLFVLVMGSQTWFLSGQDPIELPEGVPPESDWAYAKHLEQIEGIMKNSDLAQREAQLENFRTKLDPKSKILPYYESFLSQTAEAYRAAGNNSAADALVDKMTKLFPDSPALIAKELQAATERQDHPNIIRYGEKLNAINPNPQIVRILAESYIATNNAAKAVDYSAQTLEALGPQDGVYFAYWLAGYYAGQNDTDRALQYYNVVLGAFPNSSPPGWSADQWNGVKATAFQVRGRDAYVKKDYPKAIANYAEVLKYQPQNDFIHLYVGLSFWRLQRLEDAQGALAKAVVLGKDYAGQARDYLEQIYKPLNGDTLDGIEEVLNQAKAALNL
ncbi:MAG: tetratricopeptide repeat protein [Acidobacteriota bacterium]